MTANTHPPEIGVVAICRWLSRYALRRSRPMVLLLTTMVLRVGFDLAKPWPMKVLVDNALGSEPLPSWLASVTSLFPQAEHGYALLCVCVAATVVLFLASWALGAVAAVANVAFGQRMAYDLAGDLFAHLQRLSLRFHSERPTGDSIRRVTTDTGAVTTIIKDALLPALSSVVMVGAMLFVLLRMNAMLAAVSLLVVPVIVFALRRYAGPMMRMGYRQQEVDARVYDVVEQTLSAMPVVQAFAREEESDAQFRRATRDSLDATIAATRVQMKYKIATGLGTALGTSAILWFGAHQVLAHRLTLGELLVFVSYLASFYSPIETLAYTTSTIQGAAGSAQRVMEVLQAEPEIRDRPHAEPLPPVRGHVRVENVTVGYVPGRAVLRGVSFEALPGQTVAFVGATGAGKSTLLGLIPRFLDPSQGRVTIDGHDVRDVRLGSLRSQISIVLQEPLLFPISIFDNIAYGRPSATRAEVEAAAVAANADAFVRALPQGYDTVVGERGATLSGGERQRISIARALVRDAPILLLDEPTSALDAETESGLMDALRRLMAGRTTFVIAHRLSTVRHADRLVVVDGGTVVERDDVEEFVRSRVAATSPSAAVGDGIRHANGGTEIAP